jgi:hypothetical protein
VVNFAFIAFRHPEKNDNQRHAEAAY